MTTDDNSDGATFDHDHHWEIDPKSGGLHPPPPSPPPTTTTPPTAFMTWASGSNIHSYLYFWLGHSLNRAGVWSDGAGRHWGCDGWRRDESFM
jgi:hypothetical protein